MNTFYVIGTFTPRPSLVRKKLMHKEKVDADTQEPLVLKQTKHLQFLYDVVNGKIKVLLDNTCLIESINELHAWMIENKIPTQFCDESTFYLDTSDSLVQKSVIQKS